MPHLSWNLLQRGPTLKIIISVLKVQPDEADTQTEIINVKDMVDVVLKFKCDNDNIIPFIRMRKTAGAPSNCLIKISGNFNERFLCSDQWVEAELPTKSYDKKLPYNVFQYTLSYFMDVNITVHLLGSTVMLPNYNLYEDTEFTNFELQGMDGKVAVHITTLMAHSDVFKAIMRGEWKEKASEGYKIEGVTVQTLQNLKKYMYLGSLPDEGLDLLLVVAARYLMDTLTSLCITKLVESMKPEDFDGLVKLAFQHNIPDLVNGLVLRIPDNVVNGIHQLKNKDNDESKDKDESKEG